MIRAQRLCVSRRVSIVGQGKQGLRLHCVDPCGDSQVRSNFALVGTCLPILAFISEHVLLRTFPCSGFRHGHQVHGNIPSGFCRSRCTRVEFSAFALHCMKFALTKSFRQGSLPCALDLFEHIGFSDATKSL